MPAEIILRPVDVIVIVRDGEEEVPHNKRIWEASFSWVPGSSSENFKWLRGYSSTQEGAIATLYQEKDYTER